MKKKILHLFIITFMLISLTGCVKINADLEIKKDKSANFSVLYAIDTYLLNTQEILSDEDINTLKQNGFTLTEYSEGTYRGYNITKKIDNIDKVSTTDTKAEFDLASITDNNTNNKYLFAVKKGFFKNTYIANFRSSEDFSSISSTDNSSTNQNTTTNNNTTNQDTTNSNSSTLSENDLSKLTQMMSSMDISFKVKLPTKAKNSNATNKSNNDKNLEWKVEANKQSPDSIKFQFDMYNMTNIYITIGVGIILLIILIFVLIKIIKNKKGKKENQPKMENSNPTNNLNNPINSNNNQSPNISSNNQFIPPVESSNGTNINNPVPDPSQTIPPVNSIPASNLPPVNPNQPIETGNYNQAVTPPTFIPPVSPVQPVSPTTEENNTTQNIQLGNQNQVVNNSSSFNQMPNQAVPNQPVNQTTNRFVPPTFDNNIPQPSNNQQPTNPNPNNIFYQQPPINNNNSNNNPQ